jgi:hypothetical protein
METEGIQERCEVCLFFQPEDNYKHIQKNLKARNPGQSSSYDAAASLVGHSQGSSSDLGTCAKDDGKSVNENFYCDQFLHDISKNY